MRGKFVLDAGALHRLLGLPGDVQVLYAYSQPDPVSVCVVVEGAGLPELTGGLAMLHQLLGPGTAPAEATVLPHPIYDPATVVDWASAEVAA
jgi:hypothetical protein